jgi:hypothetical protein
MSDKSNKATEAVGTAVAIIGLIRAIISLFSKNKEDPNICKKPQKQDDCDCTKSPKSEE